MASTIHYYSDNSNIRGVLIYDLTTTDTQATLTIQSQLEFKTNKQAGYRVNTLIGGNVVDTATGYAPSSYSNWTKCVDTESYTKIFDRTYEDQIIEIGSEYYGEYVNPYNGGSKTGTTTLQITIPAIEALYTVTYKANGGSGAPSAQTKKHEEILKLSSTEPTRSGYIFDGWGASINGNIVTYNAGGSYNENTSIVLYAIWKKVIESNILTTEDYLRDLINQKNSLVSILKEYNIYASSDEEFNVLVPKVRDIFEAGKASKN